MEKCVENKEIEMTTQELTTLLTNALSKIMDWMPFEDISKAILIPDPRNPDKLIAVHNGPDGITLIMDDGYDEFVEETLCEECQSNLAPYSIIYTGINVETGEEDGPIGLYGSHSEDDETELEFEMEEELPQEARQKRVLN